MIIRCSNKTRKKKKATVPHLDRKWRHAAHELSAVGVIKHGHESECVAQKAVQLVDVRCRRRRLAQAER